MYLYLYIYLRSSVKNIFNLKKHQFKVYCFFREKKIVSQKVVFILNENNKKIKCLNIIIYSIFKIKFLKN